MSAWHNIVRYGVMVALIAILSGWLLPATAHAQADPTGSPSTANLETRDANGNFKPCHTVPQAKGVYLGKIVPCMLYTIQESTITFTQKMVDWLSPLLFAFLTFVIVMFGIRVASNEPEIYKHGFILLVKIAVVGIILADLGNYESYDGDSGTGRIIPAVYKVMNESQTIVSDAIKTDTLKCNVADFQAGGAPKLWATLDCIAGKVFGFTVGNNGKGNMLLVTSLIGLLTAFFFSGPWGIAIFFMMIGVIVTIFTMMMRTVLAFVNSYLIICILLIIMPLLLPLIFLKATTQYFDAVIKNILSCLLTPIVFTAFTMFALILYDKILFDQNSIVQKLLDYDQIKGALESKIPCSWAVTGDPTAARLGENPASTDIMKLFSNPMMQSFMAPMLSGGNDACAGLKVPALNITAINSPEYQKGKETLENLFRDLAKLFILAYLINMALQQLPQLVGRLSAGGGVVFQATRDGGTDLDQRFMTAAQAAVQQGSKAFGNADGTQTQGRGAVERMGAAGRTSLDTFFSVMKK